VTRPEIEAFDTGHLWFAQQLAAEGLIEDPVLIQLCMGVRWGAPDDLNTFMAVVNNVPAGWTFSAFSIGRHALAYPAAAVLAGGNVRVGLEDNRFGATEWSLGSLNVQAREVRHLKHSDLPTPRANRD
jgi:uncharacterized protein (DUF849 family)